MLNKKTSLNEMANILKNQTGLPYDIWVDSSGNIRNVQHNLPRLKVTLDKNNRIPVSISKEPEVLAKNKSKEDIPKFRLLVKWMRLNFDSLIKFWNQEIDFDALVDNLKKVR